MTKKNKKKNKNTTHSSSDEEQHSAQNVTPKKSPLSSTNLNPTTTTTSTSSTNKSYNKAIFENLIWWKHGSHDSTDVDKVYFYPHKKLPPTKESQLFLDEAAQQNEDRNVFCVQDGVISLAFIGVPNELNNALLATVPLHQQPETSAGKLPITRRTKRVVPVKVAWTFLSIMVKLRRVPSIRDAVISGFKCDFMVRKELLEKLNLLDKVTVAELTEFEAQSTGILKYLAFRIGQTLAVVHGVEVFTKTDIGNLYPELKDILGRKTNATNITEHLGVIQKKLKELLDATKYVKVTRRGGLHQFYLDRSLRDKELGAAAPWNYYELQSMGMIINLRNTESCYVQPLEWSNMMESAASPRITTMPCTWPQTEPQVVASEAELLNDLYCVCLANDVLGDKNQEEEQVQEYEIEVATPKGVIKKTVKKHVPVSTKAQTVKQKMDLTTIRIARELESEEDSETASEAAPEAAVLEDEAAPAAAAAAEQDLVEEEEEDAAVSSMQTKKKKNQKQRPTVKKSMKRRTNNADFLDLCVFGFNEFGDPKVLTRIKKHVETNTALQKVLLSLDFDRYWHVFKLEKKNEKKGDNIAELRWFSKRHKFTGDFAQ